MEVVVLSDESCVEWEGGDKEEIFISCESGIELEEFELEEDELCSGTEVEELIFAEILIGGRSEVGKLVFEEGSLGDGTKV